MNCLSFAFEKTAVRVLDREGAPWFVTVDLCRVLEIANPRDAVTDLDVDEKGVGNTDTLGGTQRLNLVSESGLYALIFKSRKPKARKFRKWVTSEVLPAIRKRGCYEARQAVLEEVNVSPLRGLRKLLLSTAEGVASGSVAPAKASAVALLAGRYLETIKIEGEAIGYEKMFGLWGAQAADGFLPNSAPGAEPLQGLSQRAVQPAAADGSGLPEAAVPGEEGLGDAAPGETESLRESGAEDFQENGSGTMP